ncbi:MAG TPA: hypothetical protein VKY24_13440 [Reyranella sp.]|nr:hypothetical protein [Reyranella sp.]
MVATTWAHATSVLDRGANAFRLVGNAFNNVFVLPRQRISVAFTGDWRGMVVGRDALESWAIEGELHGQGIRGLTAVYDSDVLKAMVALDLDQRLWVRADAGRWRRLETLGRWEFGDVLDAPRSGAAIYIGQKTVLAIRRKNDAAYSTHTLADTTANDAANTFFRSALLGELLHYGPGGFLDRGEPRWFRLRGAQFEDIPGLPVGLPKPITNSAMAAHDLPSLGKVVLRGPDGLYLYDGERATLVADSDWTSSIEPYVDDLSGIGRVTVRVPGRAETIIDGRLRSVPQILPYHLFDWPGSGVVGQQRNRLVLFDKDWAATPIVLPGLTDRATIYAVSRTASPRNGALFVSTSEGIFVLAPKGSSCL